MNMNMKARTLEQKCARLGELLRITLDAEYEAQQLCHELDKELAVPENWGSDWFEYWTEQQDSDYADNPEYGAALEAEWKKETEELLDGHNQIKSAISKLTAAERKALKLNKDGSHVKDTK